MSNVPLVFAKLAALYKQTKNISSQVYVSSDTVIDLHDRYTLLIKEFQQTLPELYEDLPIRKLKPSNDRTEKSIHLSLLMSDMEYILEVRANSEIVQNEVSEPKVKMIPNRIFISHGRSPDWREVQGYIEKDLNLPTLELAQEPSRGRTVLQKLSEESEACSFAVIVMTGDDEVTSGAPRARENVIHEIGFFQGKYGLPNVCLLHEQGTNIPSNIHGLVYVPFPKGLISATFGVLAREIRAALAKLS